MAKRVTEEENQAAIEDFKRNVLSPLVGPPELAAAEQLEMYRQMFLIREFDIAVRDLWRRNFIRGLAHSYVSAEAIAVGACAALREGDYITSTHRGHGHTIAKGGDIRLMMAELMAKAPGYCNGKGGSMHIAAVDVGMLGATGIVGSAMPIAVGAALTAKTLGQNYVTICFHGDGGTNQGVWHESINLAAVWNLPVIFLCENNQWAISLPYNQAARNPTVSDRAVGYGIPGVTVDGFNPFAVYEAVREAADRARRGEGPTLIEARFFRYIGHQASDDEAYRNRSNNEPWMQLDPVKRMAEYLVASGQATEADLETTRNAARAALEGAIEYAKQAPEPATDALYDGLYSPAFLEAHGGDL